MSGRRSNAELPRRDSQHPGSLDCEDDEVTLSASRPRALAASLVVGGVLGLVAALALTLEKLATNTGAAPSCNINPLIGCGASLDSAQGAILGMPNSLLGLMFWPVVIVVGMLAGTTPIPRWLWLCLGVALAGATALVVWFIVQSIAVLGVLCPWCMLTWAVTIPLFFAVLVHLILHGMLPAPRTLVRAVQRIPLLALWLTIVAFVVIASAAQLQLDIVGAL